MASTAPAPTYGDSNRAIPGALVTYLQRWQAWLPLILVTALALLVNAWGLSEAGYGNTYYAAAVRSMSQSWHNFFFGAFDPGGFITVDKPPVFLWFDALSVRIFGYSSLSLLLPSAVAGAASVALLWLIMRRYFGVVAATIAALVLALTPISVAVNRLNLPEPFLLLALIAAAGCILRSLDSKPWLWWTIAAGLLVGIAFNTKMLVGWIPGPALVLALIVGTRGDWWKAWQDWIPRLAVFGSVALIASASWMLVVDHWPGDRPYVGGSTDNTVYDLMLGYNGIERVEGFEGFNQGGGRQQNPGLNPNATGSRTPNIRGAGGIIAGEPGLFRMFDEANGGQIAWFLPFAAIGGAVSLWRWRSDPVLRAAVLLWLGWLLLYGGAFSYAEGIYHSYYTAALAPGVAALVGMSCVAMPDLIRRHKAWLGAPIAIATASIYVQLLVAGRFDGFFEWVTPLAVIVAIGGAALVATGTISKRVPMLAGTIVLAGGLMLIPAAWSGYEAAHASSNATLPQAGPRNAGPASRSFGSQAFDAGIAQLAKWLQANSDPGTRWDLAVRSAQNASTLIAEHGVSVMAIGGFSGNDPSITIAEFGELVASGDIRYVLVRGGIGSGTASSSRILPNLFRQAASDNNLTLSNIGSAGFAARIGLDGAGAEVVMIAVTAACKPVEDPTLPVQYRGGIFDCAGAAD